MLSPEDIWPNKDGIDVILTILPILYYNNHIFWKHMVLRVRKYHPNMTVASSYCARHLNRAMSLHENGVVWKTVWITKTDLDRLKVVRSSSLMTFQSQLVKGNQLGAFSWMFWLFLIELWEQIKSHLGETEARSRKKYF